MYSRTCSVFFCSMALFLCRNLSSIFWVFHDPGGPMNKKQSGFWKYLACWPVSMSGVGVRSLPWDSTDTFTNRSRLFTKLRMRMSKVNAEKYLKKNWLVKNNSKFALLRQHGLRANFSIVNVANFYIGNLGKLKHFLVTQELGPFLAGL